MSAFPSQPPIPEGPLIETQKGYQPRVIFFYLLLGILIAILAGGLAYRQILQSSLYEGRERIQNQRRIVTPGPRGDILDREGRVLAGSRPQISVVLWLDELRSEFRKEYYVIQNRYTREIEAGTPGVSRPEDSVINRTARADVVQRYLDQLNAITGSSLTVDRNDLERHFLTERLLPYVLVSDLEPGDYAKLLDQLPIDSPLQIYPTSERIYPYGSAASHTIGSVRVEPNIETDYLDDGDLSTFKMPGIRGREGLEAHFDDTLQGKAGSKVLQVDPAGYPIDTPLDPNLPEVPARQGQPLVTSIDIDLQLAAEQAIGDQRGGVALLDVNTGEVLALVSKPNYDLNAISPRMSFAARDEIEANRAWQNLAVNGLYPPGSTFKILNAIAGLRAGTLTRDKVIVDCDGVVAIGGRLFYCDNGSGHHHEVTLVDAIAQSCDIYFYEAARLTSPEQLAAEARRFHLDRSTGIQLPETNKMIIPDPDWAKRETGITWRPGDTANMGIGQGYVRVTPLEMAAFMASVARNEVTTVPTLLHDPSAPRQHSESIGLTDEQRAALIDGMIGAVNDPNGTARAMSQVAAYRIPGVQVAGKTGTAQVRTEIDGKIGTINIAWFVCFAPVDNPQVALAVAIEGEELGESFYGSRYAVPVAATVLKKYFEKQAAR